MTKVQRSIRIDASPEDVMAISTDTSRLPDWYAGIEEAAADDQFPETGGKVQLVYKAAGMTFNITQTALDYQPGKSQDLKLDGMIAGTSHWEFAPEDGGTRVEATFDYTIPGGALGKITDKLVVERMNAKNLEDSLSNLKALVESQ